MRKWLARKLFNLAVRLDWEGAAEAARIIIAVEDSWKAAFAPKKRGRPAGRKDSVAGVPPKKKIGRPLGSKNKSPSGKNKSPSGNDKSPSRKVQP
jgi:hypothetical protein